MLLKPFCDTVAVDLRMNIELENCLLPQIAAVIKRRTERQRGVANVMRRTRDQENWCGGVWLY